MHVHTLRYANMYADVKTPLQRNTCICTSAQDTCLAPGSQKMHTHAPANACLCNSAATSTLWKLLRTFQESWVSFWSTANTNIELNRDDALAEPNFQRQRACWFNMRQTNQPPVFVTTSRHPAQETIKIHASTWRGRGCCVTQASSDYTRSSWYGSRPAPWLILF